MLSLQNQRKRVQIWRWASSFLILAALLVCPAAQVASAAISQGYQASENLVSGSLVSLVDKSNTSVQAANTEHLDGLLGVVVTPGDALLSLTSGSNQVQVASSGLVQAIVSTINGPIKTGDHITASPLSGVGMKAISNGRTIGVAQADFNQDTAGASKQSLKTKDGKTQDVWIGQVSILIGIENYTVQQDESKSPVPEFFQQFMNTIVGKAVSPIRIVIAIVIFLIALITVVTLIYAAIKSSITSIGRNPLSQKAITRSLVQVIAAALGILAVSGVVIYLVFTR